MLEHLEAVKRVAAHVDFSGWFHGYRHGCCHGFPSSLFRNPTRLIKTHQHPWRLLVESLEIDFKTCQGNRNSENAKSRTEPGPPIQNPEPDHPRNPKPLRHLWCVTVSESLTWMTQSPRPHSNTTHCT